MAKDKNAPRYDKQGARRVMRKRDYLADLGGQLALGLMANLVGQLNYFYTDKVGLAVGSVGIVLAISKVIDAFTDVIAGNFIDHSKGGDHKYFRWILPQIIPAALIMVLMFTVPIQAGQIPGVIYALITNLVLSAGLYTFIATFHNIFQHRFVRKKLKVLEYHTGFHADIPDLVAAVLYFLSLLKGHGRTV